MGLSSELISQFVKITKDEPKPSNGKTVTGTATLYDGKIYVQLDGSDQLTPILSSTAGVKDGDRVTVLIKDHSATVTGNTSSPSAGQGDIEDAKTEIGNKISEVEILIADKVDTIEFNAEKARIDELVAENVTIKGDLTAVNAKIDNIEAGTVTTDDLEAINADIENLKATKIDADIADLKYATVGSLEATNADIHNLEVDYGSFKDLTTEKFSAVDAEITKLDTEKLSADEAELKYANIDFANIGKAAIENFFSKSGMIGDLVVGDGTITGTLVGVTIKGDLIEGGTVVADKLVLKGTDGLYYKLNTTGATVSAEQTEYNSLNGSIITAKSVTAEKINVNDLVAFGATIGGFKIDDHSLYSGVKESVDNTTRGIFMGDDGQFAVGDSSNFLKFYKDADGTYKLAISASQIKLGTSGKDIEEVVSDAVTDIVEEFYQSDSPTELIGGAWSETQPTWTEGKYIWRRSVTTYGDGSTEYTPSETGVCITGNTGASGEDGADSILLQILSSNGNMFKNSTLSTTLTVTIIVGDETITSSEQMISKFGSGAVLKWEQKRFGETEFTPLEADDDRLSDNGFILTLQPDDVYTQTVFNCNLEF